MLLLFFGEGGFSPYVGSSCSSCGRVAFLVLPPVRNDLRNVGNDVGITGTGFFNFTSTDVPGVGAVSSPFLSQPQEVVEGLEFAAKVGESKK